MPAQKRCMPCTVPSSVVVVGLRTSSYWRLSLRFALGDFVLGADTYDEESEDAYCTSDWGMAALAKSFETGGLPKLACDDWSVRGFFRRNPRASASAVQAARDALTKRSQ